MCSLVAVLFVALIAQANTACTNYDPQSPSQKVTETLNFCAPFVSQQVWIPSNVSQDFVATNLTQNYVFEIIQNVKSILPLKCYKQVMGMMCQSAFPSCVGSSPNYPCQTMCEATLHACGNIWHDVGLSAPFGCASNPVVGGPFPAASCSATVFPANAVADYHNPIIANCPTVYDFNVNPNDNKAICAMKCPDPGYTKEEYNKTIDFFITLAIISIILQLYLILSYLIDYKKRQFPARIQFFLFISNFGYAVASLFSAEQKTMCANATEYSTQDTNSLCAAQAFLLILFTYGAILWVCVLAVVTFLCVVLEIRPNRLKKYEKYIHLGVWGWILTCLFIICGFHSLDYGYPTRSYCFIKVDASLSISIDYPLFYIPAIISVIITFLMFIACITKLILYRRSGGKKGVAAKATLKAQKRIIVVIAMLSIIFGVAFGFRFSTTKEMTRQTIADRTLWINCKLRSELLGLPYPKECDSEINPLRRSLGGIMFQNTLPALGIFIFIAFGTDRKMFLHWVALVRCLISGDFEKLKKSVMHGYSVDTTTHPHNAHGTSKSSKSTNSADGTSNSSSFVAPAPEEVGRSTDGLTLNLAAQPESP